MYFGFIFSRSSLLTPGRGVSHMKQMVRRPWFIMSMLTNPHFSHFHVEAAFLEAYGELVVGRGGPDRQNAAGIERVLRLGDVRRGDLHHRVLRVPVCDWYHRVDSLSYAEARGQCAFLAVGNLPYTG